MAPVTEEDGNGDGKAAVVDPVHNAKEEQQAVQGGKEKIKGRERWAGHTALPNRRRRKVKTYLPNC
jgi:hypothetical protein